MSFDLSLIAVSLPKILQGLGLTLNLLAVSTLFGLILAVGILLMRLSRRAWLIWPAKAYIYFFRGTPLLVQLFVIYHGLPQFGFIRQSVLWPLLREPYWCSVIALSLNTAAYVSEILRGGVLGVDKGLIEAGKALGLSKFQRTSRITAPLAVRLALPAYSNEIVSMLKSTALASTVTLMEMTGVARTIVADTFAPYEIFIAATIIYLVLVWIIQTGFTLVETYANRHVRKT
ncbi:ABC transporter permease [Shinella yambaruensis]|uniref:ABC transporter permease n=1 Tax=Shinella yambaruensis TaxID=415996 RepID=A0ABQ5ZSF3_9HYPH|nr:ABC transporter permease [Shinella yambaruensis]MCJ8029184.1 ABC transporter permease [Shinella yambaruensis]MCU7983463.1 ABC transporter permease [Shinella yambaruensis]GLR55080.1 ABC transporter permease [Shinella yambaruensis]